MDEQTGRELDAAVAERVMGWISVWAVGYSLDHFIGGHYSTPEACQLDCKREGQRPIHLWADGGGYTQGRSMANWSPSSDPAAAWHVVERFTDVAIEKCGESYAVTISGHASAQAATMPEAVCRAALAAVTKGGRDG